nr:hypothetical protein L204_02382 [Cryptococcus depauperatus CBS 7855]
MAVRHMDAGSHRPMVQPAAERIRLDTMGIHPRWLRLSLHPHRLVARPWHAGAYQQYGVQRRRFRAQVYPRTRHLSPARLLARHGRCVPRPAVLGPIQDETAVDDGGGPQRFPPYHDASWPERLSDDAAFGRPASERGAASFVEQPQPPRAGRQGGADGCGHGQV